MNMANIPNPKLKDSLIIDCIPQFGSCPLDCMECYYNGGRFYRPLEPLLPTLEEAEGKIVRVNSGHDSNLQYELVMESTKEYRDKYYNTSLPLLRFNAPTTLTINGRDTNYTFYKPSEVKGDLNTLASIRFRINTWNMDLCEKAIVAWEDYPFLLTDMRYYDKNNVKKIDDYIWKRSHINDYWMLTDDALNRILDKLLGYKNVYLCGNPFNHSNWCRDCRLCEHLYEKCKRRIRMVKE